MLPTQAQMTAAITWFCAQDPRPSAYYTADKFGIPYDMMRGGMIAHGVCPEPKHAGRQCRTRPDLLAEIRALPKKAPGRPRNPLLEPDQAEWLKAQILSRGKHTVARGLNVSWSTLWKAACRTGGLNERTLEILKSRIEYESRAGVRVDWGMVGDAGGNRDLQNAEIVEDVKRQRGGHFELNSQGEKIWVPYK